MDKDYFVHESSYIDEGAKIGRGTKIWHFCHIMSDVQIGENCSFGQNTSIDSGVRIGNTVKVQNNTNMCNGVVLEDEVFIGPSCTFTNVINPRSFIIRKEQLKQTIVKKGASIGGNVTLVCGHNIGKYAFVGAGSVVTKEVPDYGLVYGSPAKLKGYVCECGDKLPEGVTKTCTSCGLKYHFENECLVESK